jgi:hypothetical protein
MDQINVRFTIGLAYFGEPRLIRDVFEIITQAAMGHTRKIVTKLEHVEDTKIGVLAQIEATAHPDASKQIAAAIRQSMGLPNTVPIEIIFDDSDVMESDNIDDLFAAVTEAQKGIREMTSNIFDRFLGYW